MSVTYKIKKESLYNNDSSEMTRVIEDNLNNPSLMNLLTICLQTMICEINTRAEEDKQ